MNHEAWRRRDGDRPLVLGHRGARAHCPENTMAAFERALEDGADGVELDVRLDAAGEVIVLHDPTLKRVTGGVDHREAESVDRRALEQVDIGDGERVPRLTTVLAWARHHRARLNIEIKRDVSRPFLLTRRVAALVCGMPHADRHIILSSFDFRLVALHRRLAPKVPTAWLVHEKQRLLKSAPGRRWVGASAVHPERLLCSSKQVRKWKQSGALVNVWTVNDPTEARDLANLGVDGLISDDPGLILDAVS